MLRGKLVEQRPEDEAEALDVPGHPAGAIDDSRWPGLHAGCHAGVAADV
jgi:hypothetical protein